MMSPNTVPRLLGASLLALIPLAGWADSGVGVDTWRANKLDPTGGMAVQQCDSDGTSWLAPLQHQSPTGNLYNCPPQPAPPPLIALGGGWEDSGFLQFGYVHAGDQRYALWNRYTDWQRDQPVLGLLDMEFLHPEDGTYAEARGSRIGDDDQFYQLAFGQAGAYKAQIFMRDMPNILSTDARPLWNGAGGSVQTLPSSLTPAQSSSAQVAAASTAISPQTMEVVRRKQGLNLSGYLTPQWTGYLDVTHETREGARPFGGPFGEDWPPYAGAILETVKPIDDTTINLNAGIRFADSVWRGEFGYSGSYYRDHYLGYSFQQPFLLPTLAPAGTITAPPTQGQMSMEPDNDYHNIHVSVTRATPFNGEASLGVSEVLMENRSALIPPTNCQGFLGWGTPVPGATTLTPQAVGPQNPNLFQCSQWNTTAALSQTHANVNMHNTLVTLGTVMRPETDLQVDAGFKFYRQAYYNNYIAYNPLNGYYGYIGENGAFAYTVGAPLSYASGNFVNDATAINGRVRPYLLSMDDYDFHGGATWRMTESDSIGAIYTFDEYRPTSRERSYVDDNSIKLTWVDKSLGWATFRANYTFLRQTGSVYNTDVYGYTFLSALPGFQQALPNFVIGPETDSALRKYDIANRSESKLDLMGTFIARENLTITASFRADWNAYPTQVGRQGYNTTAAQISAEWTPTTADNVSAYIGYDRSYLGISNIAGYPGLSNTPSCGTPGCPFYPLADQWWESDHERNYAAGLTFQHRMHLVTFDLAWNYIYARGTVYYSAASANALVYPQAYATMGSGFPANTYRVNSATAGVTVALNERLSLRVFDNYEIGRIFDWHYEGFNQGLVVGNTLYTDGGPQSYSENLVGFFVNLKL